MSQREAIVSLIDGKRIYTENGGCYWLDNQGRLWYSSRGMEHQNAMFSDIVSLENLMCPSKKAEE